MKQYRLLERQHPIFSPIALLSTLILAGALGIGIFLTGGRAFSPGDLSAVNNSGQLVGNFETHADFADDCGQCHEPFKGVTAVLCENCHENVTVQRETGEGIHGRIDPTEVQACANCHLEHRGADYDLLQAAILHFDHGVTRFSLAKHPTDYDGSLLECESCHTDTNDYSQVGPACQDCHQQADTEFMAIHTQTYGDNCLNCHDGLDTMADFTMAQHEEIFPLVGKHAETMCENCHQQGQFDDLPSQCVNCHEEPAVHFGLFTDNCEECHSAEGWKPAIVDGQPFDHAVNTRFSLVKHATNYDGQPFTCVSCHEPDTNFAFAESGCETCHAQADPDFMTQHVAEFGTNCMDCHDGTGSMANFDHSQFFVLDGQHAVIDCQACHVDQVFAGTPNECAGCHEEPLIHAGLFGLQCQACHTTSAWQPAQLKEHTFPLNHGGQGEIACATCHLEKYTEYTCYGCHEHNEQDIIREHAEEGISAAELPNCVKCHPTGREEEGGRGD